jgi:plastocyanin
MRLSVLPAVVLFAIACGSDSTPTSTKGSNKSYDVYTVSTAFSPSFVTINAGDTVVFHITKAPDGDGHDVTFDATTGAPANIKVTLTGDISRVFNTRGTFHYNCFVHPGMTGDVQVK